MGQGSPVNGRFASFSALNRGLARIPRISKITFVMPYFAADQRSPWQQTILDVVSRYPGRFTRSGLVRMLVGTRSLQDISFPGMRLFCPTHAQRHFLPD
jgi:hypothetical protein